MQKALGITVGVVLFCWGIFFVCLAEEDKDTEKEKRWSCPQCYSTGKAECASCFGSGHQTAPCPSCKGNGVCKKCKGDRVSLCSQCKGKGTVEIIVGGLSGEGRTRECECPKCKGQGKISCKECKEMGVCAKCEGRGLIVRKEKCIKCKGTGQSDCPYCEGNGKIDNTKVISYKIVCDDMDKSFRDFDKATDLQKDKIIRDFVAKWNKKFANKSIEWKGVVEEITSRESWDSAPNHISLMLKTDEDISLSLNVATRWKEQLLEISKGDSIEFLAIFPPKKVEELRRAEFRWEYLPFEDILPVMFLRYKKMGQEEVKEFTPPSE